MSLGIKRSAIIYAGYRYQTLQGVMLLAEWLTSPTRYKAVRFECDDSEIAPQALDDIVAVRADGKQDYTQVKYTPDESITNYPLSWDWLLAVDTAKKNSRSFLRKWFDAFKKIDPDQIGEARLITNREPDREISSCLRDGFIDYALVPAGKRAELDKQLNGAAEASLFLASFKIQHSDRSYESLDRNIRSALRKLRYEDGGIERLLNRAHDWSIIKNRPEPDGWISLEILRSILSAARPTPILEDFVVPMGYTPNDEMFHQKLFSDVTSSSGGVFSVVGPPGQGKSTYLSYFCKALEAAQIPVIRHHYFLSVNDKSVDRLTPYVVADSLLSQISKFHAKSGASTQRSEDLANAIRVCAEYYKAKSKLFVVIIDGLDHVWRDNDRDKRPLDDIFRQLLPVVPNLVVIVGTQPVDDNKLPDVLLLASKRSEWRELPTMSADAVYAYVNQQIAAGRWLLPEKGAKEEQLRELARALHGLTKGNPLLVIYSTEHLLATDRAPTVHDIEALPACPDGNIRNYYMSLWQKLTHPQQDALHLLCKYPFFWPRRAFSDPLLASGAVQVDVRGIEHLLHDTSVGLKPFHESLIVFVTEQHDHIERVEVLSSVVEEWLRDKAPPVLRGSWLWTVQAQRGNSVPLVDGLTRDWVLDRLADGYAVGTFIRMLGEAEEYAFKARQYPRTYELRSLKTRLLNGPEFQLEDAARLLGASWAISEDQSVIDDTWVARRELPTYSLAVLGLSLHRRGDVERAKVTIDEARARFQSEFRFMNERSTRGLDAMQRTLLRIRVVLGMVTVKILAERNFDQWPVEVIETVANSFAESHGLPELMAIRKLVTSAARARHIEEAAIRAAVIERAKLAAWREFSDFAASTLSLCWRTVAGHLPGSQMPHTPIRFEWSDVMDWDSRIAAFDDSVREWFLKTVAVALNAEADFSWIPTPTSEKQKGIARYLDELQRFALHAAKTWAEKRSVDFNAAFLHFDSMAKPSGQGHDEWQQHRDFRRALISIALDCHFISAACGGASSITLSSLISAEPSEWFNSAALRASCIRLGLRVLAPDAAERLIIVGESECWSRLEETCNTAATLLELCELAVLYGMSDTARRLCRVCWDVVIGFGHRKDPTLQDVLSAIEYLATAEPTEAKRMLFELAPQIHSVTEYTDGKGTRHAHSQASELLAKLDRCALVAQHRQYAAEGSWYYAENATRHLVASMEPASAVAAPLARTGLLNTEIGLTVESALAGDKAALAIASATAEHLGRMIESLADEDRSSGYDPSRFTGNPSDYPPKDFSRLLTDIHDSKTFGGLEYIPSWFAYWKSNGKASDLVRYVTPILLAGNTSRLDTGRLWDPLFDITLELAGAAKAFDIAVKAQIENGGWGGFMDSPDRIEARLQKVANIYPERADEFIAKSTKNFLVGRHNPTSLVVPSEYLVFFLVKLGRIEDARQLIASMIKCVVEDTRNLRLPKPAWAHDDG